MKTYVSLALAFAGLCASAEAQDFSAWSSHSGSADLSVTTDAAYPPTTYGMQAVVNDGDILLVRDNSPSAETRYRVRFYFNTNNYALLDQQRQRIFTAQRDSDNLRVVTLIFRRVAGGNASLLARTYEEGTGTRDMALGQHAEGWHMIEFDWQRETGAATTDGRLQAWVDGVQRGNFTNLNNFSAGGVDFARMGVMTPITGSGTLYFDEFESRRQTAIGPIAP